jgi:hypothetical protein
MLILSACSQAAPDETTSAQQSAIVRGKPEAGYPQVMMIHSELYGGGVAKCSGTYVAPRVVLTAAHCLQDGRLDQGTFVYWGNDYEGDLDQLVASPFGPSTAPAPDAGTSWALAEATTIIPGYSAELNSPDLAVLYLDRLPPFDPLPLYRPRLDDKWVGKKAEIVGWGASAALTADLSQTEGGGVKRSGRSPIAGTPTEADYDPNDPNPGLLDPQIRETLIKVDGSAPKSNICAGDSGGPLIVRERGQEYVAGVAMWTGLWCEEYSIFTRLDSFLPFLDNAFRLAGQAPVVPHLECVDERADGSYTAYFGYENANAVRVMVPYGTDTNYLPLDTASERPTTFAPGEHPWMFGVDFAEGEQVFYKLAPPNGPATELRVDASSPRCATGDVRLSCAHTCETQLAAACEPAVADRGTFAQCVADCIYAGENFFGTCTAEFARANECTATLPAEDPSLWMCFEGLAPFPAAGCDEAIGELYACAGF